MAPPPPPRRHSDPTHTNLTDTSHTVRRYSEIKNLPSKLDLRQELQNLNLNKQEYIGWLGNEFEETDEFEDHEQFKHNVLLQRSVSLDRGIDIFKYLQALGSDWSGSEIGSSWTVHSDEGDGLVFGQYKSFEDIPASLKVKSRRVSSDAYAAYGRNVALSVLKDSYKGMEMDGLSFTPQIKKLQRSFTFPDKLEDFIEAVKSSTENLNETSRHLLRCDSPSSSRTSDVSGRSGLLRMKTSHKSTSCRNSSDYLEVDRHRPTEDDDDRLEIRTLFYRSISMVANREDKEIEPTLNMRLKRIGVNEQSYQKSKKEINLRKDVLNKSNLSCESIAVKMIKPRPGIADTVNLGKPTQVQGIYDLNFDTGSTAIAKCSSMSDLRRVPKIVVTDYSGNYVANNENITEKSSKIVENVEISRCDCRICTDDVADEKGFVARKILGKLLMKIVSYREYGRKLTYWDENNNLNESEMYKCIMNVLKLMLGLWLRHLDHNNDP